MTKHSITHSMSTEAEGETADSAMEIVQDLLDRTGEALITGDVDTFTPYFAVPQELETFEGTRRLETEEDVAAMFWSLRNYFLDSGVTRLVRVCIEAEYQGPDTILATHVSHPMKGTSRTQGPYPVMSVIKQIDGAWKVVRGQYAVAQGSELLKTVLK